MMNLRPDKTLTGGATSRRDLVTFGGAGLLAGIVGMPPSIPSIGGQQRTIAAHSMWMHGNGMQTEIPDNLSMTERYGWLVTVEGKPQTSNWFHFAISTPVIVDGDPLRLSAVMLRFRTASRDALVRHVHVFDGEERIATLNDLYLSGDHLREHLTVPGHPQVSWGLCISLGVTFGDDPDNEARRIEFIGVGCELIR